MLASEAVRRFINGITLWKEKTRLVVPLELAMSITGVLLVLIITDDVLTYPGANLIEKFIAYNITYPIFVEGLVILKNKDSLREISRTMDRWWRYAYLEEQTSQLKKKAYAGVEKFTSAYYMVMIGGFFNYLLLPIIKYFIRNQKDIRDTLLYRCWTPFDLQNPWGFCLIYLFQVVGLHLPFFTFAAISTYLVTMTQLFRHQVDLISWAFSTIHLRVRLQARKLHQPGCDFRRLQARLMQDEISNCARHYQSLYRCLARMCSVFSYTTNIMYYSGLCVVVYSGLQAVTKINQPMIVTQSLVLIFSVFLNQYLITYVTESLAEKASDLRTAIYGCGWYDMPLTCRQDIHLMIITTSYSPKLTTIIGTVCNKVSFMAIINASYYYINTLITMKIHS